MGYTLCHGKQYDMGYILWNVKQDEFGARDKRVPAGQRWHLQDSVNHTLLKSKHGKVRI